MSAPSKHAHRLLFRYGQRLLAAERSGACAADPMAALQAMAEAQREVAEYIGGLEERVAQLERWGVGAARRVKPFPAEREPDETERAIAPASAATERCTSVWFDTSCGLQRGHQGSHRAGNAQWLMSDPPGPMDRILGLSEAAPANEPPDEPRPDEEAPERVDFASTDFGLRVGRGR